MICLSLWIVELSHSIGPVEQRISELEAAIARLEARGSRPADADAALILLRAELARLRGSSARPQTANLESERKLVTILFADISGFTALAETSDPEAARELVEAYFQRMTPIIEKYNGTVEKFIGDEIMALFGAPLTSENDAECALRAALEMIEEFGRFKVERDLDLGLHFGINTGLVIAGRLGARGHEQYAVTGDAVNLASRLRDVATSNVIMVGQETYRLSTALFEFEKQPALSVKGKAKPLEVYRLIGPRGTPGMIRGIEGLRSPLVGRKEEFERLQGPINALAQGKGGTIAILGEAGLGKSRLVAELRKSLPERICWFEARGLSYGERLSYGVARALVQGLMGMSDQTEPGESARILRTRIETLFPDRSEEVLPYLAHLCDLPLEEKLAERVKYLSPEALQGQLLRSFQAYVRARATAGPLVLVWEDLHWVDPSSLRLLGTLLPVTAEAPLLLLLVSRSFEEGHFQAFLQAARGTGSGFQTIELAPLTREHSAELIENLLRIENLPEETRSLILEKAEGNPFFVEELLRALIDAGLLILRRGDTVALPQIREIEVPRTLQGLIAARIDRLTLPDKRALQTASVIGRIFQRGVLDNLLKTEPEPRQLDESLGELQRRALIRQREAERALSDREYIFKHAITQEVTYQSVSLTRRKALHRTIAESIEALFPDRLDELAASLAYHYERAEIRRKAINYLTKAAERAQASYANEEAIRFFRASLKQAGLMKSDPTGAGFGTGEVAKLEERLGDTLLNAARYEEARAAFSDAMALIPDGVRLDRARLLRKQGKAWFNQRRIEECLASYDLAEAALGPALGPQNLDWWKEWLAVGLDRIGPLYFVNRLTALTALVERLQPIVEQYGTPSQRRDMEDSLTLIELRQCRYYMAPDKAVDRTRQLLSDSRAAGDLGDIAHYHFALGFVHLSRNEQDEAKRELEAGLKLALRIGDVAQQTKCLTYLALTNRKLCHQQETERYSSRALAAAREANNLVYLGAALANLAWVAWRRGDVPLAEQHARAAAEAWKDSAPAGMGMLWELWILLGIALSREQIQAAMDCAKGILDPSQWLMPPELSAGLAQALQAWQESNTVAARARLAEVSEVAKSLGYL
jgi:class 3 adenylate cyclase/tetratricopeptide (TPR) repeat protein